MPNQEDYAEISSSVTTFKLAAEGKLPNIFGDSRSSSPIGVDGNGEKNMFIYPLEMMQEKTDYLLIRIFNYERSSDVFGLDNGFAVEQLSDEFNRSRNQAKLETNTRYIFLPIPQAISDSISVSYAEDTINPLQVAGLSVAGGALTEGPGALVEAAKKGLEKAKSMLRKNLGGIDPGTMKTINAALAGVALNQLGANVSPQSIITRATGQILQSNLELLFSGVTLRSFPFTYDFVARDPREGQEIKGIIRTLKKAMSPKGGNPRNPVFINSPDVFQLEYRTGNQNHPFLNSFKICALSDLSVNYTGSGTYATYGDGTPVHIQVSMIFKEINPIYAEDYDVLAEGGYTNVGY